MIAGEVLTKIMFLKSISVNEVSFQLLEALVHFFTFSEFL